LAAIHTTFEKHRYQGFTLTRIQSDFCLRHLEIFLENSRIRKYKAKKTIIHLGDYSESLFYILSGSVTVATEDPDGREIILAYLNPGDFAGEMGLFETNPRSARIRAKTNCELGELSYKKFLKLSENHPELLFAVARQLAKQLASTSTKVRDLAFMDVSGRVAGALINLCQQPDAHPMVDCTIIRSTRQEIAKLIGCSREMVGRVLKQFDEANYISLRGKKILVYKGCLQLIKSGKSKSQRTS
jgi:CRP/FNR family cyclic AMP-dependent transcriptional regulator